MFQDHKPSKYIPKADRMRPLMVSHKIYMNFCFFLSILSATSSQRRLGENSGGVVPDSTTPLLLKRRKHHVPLTYKHKMLPVLLGKCNQTIRRLRDPKRRKNIGDTCRITYWWGRPYYSKQYIVLVVELEDVLDIMVSESGISAGGMFTAWGSQRTNQLAKLDYIDPPTGEGLKNVLFGFHNVLKDDEQIPFQILHWDTKSIKFQKMITITNKPQPIRSLFPFGGDA